MDNLNNLSDEKQYHSIELIPQLCIGCTECLKRCPAEAIRIRKSKAVIINEKCIDCGMCIKVCRNHAKKSTTKPLSIMNKYKYKVALPAPSLYAQFKNIHDPNIILTALKRLGFDEVFEVAYAADYVTAKTKEIIAGSNLKKPIISSACPVIIRLICSRFPSLIGNILPVLSPMEIAAQMAKDYYESKGIRREDIGVLFISPCASKATYVMHPIGHEESSVDAVISMQDIYMPLRNAISSLDKIEVLSQSTHKGMGWALSGGESKNVEIENAIAVDGLDDVMDVLEELENGQINDVDFIEALACTGGCVGGPLTVENAFVAKNYLKRTEKFTQEMNDDKKRIIHIDETKLKYIFDKDPESSMALKLDNNVAEALAKLEKKSEIISQLPLIDCGSCGSPSCATLAEDIVCGNANIEDCVFMLRKKVTDLAELMLDLSSKLPKTLRVDKVDKSEIGDKK